MIGLLRSIVDAFTALIGLIINTITSFINLLLHIPTYQDFLVTSIGFMPSLVLPFCVASISVYIIFLILGRNH